MEFSNDSFLNLIYMKILCSLPLDNIPNLIYTNSYAVQLMLSFPVKAFPVWSYAVYFIVFPWKHFYFGLHHSLMQ